MEVIPQLSFRMFSLLLLLSVFSGKAQEVEKRVKSVQVEALGSSVMGGVSYDSRFKGTEGFGFRLGVAFSAGTTRQVGVHKGYEANGVTLPIELNYIQSFVGSHFGELAVGVNAGIYRLKDATRLSLIDTKIAFNEPRSSKTTFGYNNFINMGYRYQCSGGFVFRGGVYDGF